MDATTMAVTNWLVERLQTDYPDFRFQADDHFRWSPSGQVIHYCYEEELDTDSLLHELAHAKLQHQDFSYDIDLIKIEREAWDYASATLAPQYGLQIDSDVAEDALDSYRQWLHRRSRCPNCEQTGLQSRDGSYKCLSCLANWHANDARRCALRRYITPSKNPL